MRVIAGKCKGLKLRAPAGLFVRPTGDRVKESTFAILGEKLKAALVLDLFAGCGNLAIEAYSRGAAQVICVDNDAVSLKYIYCNIETAGAGSHVKIYRGDALQAVKLFSRQGILFDFIFADPHYKKGLIQRTLTQIKKNNILTKDGIIVVEYSRHEKFLLPAGLVTVRNEKYGDVMVAFIAQADKGG